MKARTIKKYEELWNKIRYIIRLITNNSGNYDEKYVKIKFNPDGNLPLKTFEFYMMIIDVRSVFYP